ncbi:MAG: Calx-beta domain-containing protein [Cyclobacteriaceae bacterium]
MQKIITFLFLALITQLFSCKDEDAPAATISFSNEGTIVGEADGIVSIPLALDRAPSNNLVVNYTMTGSAQLDEDYVATGSVEIAAGATEAGISITLLDDDVFEFDEEILELFGKSIQITLSGVTGNAFLTDEESKLSHTVLIREDDPIPLGLTFDLTWDAGGGSAGDVDMDLILWYFNASTNEPIPISASQQIGTAFESIEVPNIIPDGNYGVTLRYFEGTSDDVDVNLEISAFNDITLPGSVSTLTRTGIYTLANVNGDESAGATVEIVLTFTKVGSQISDISEIDVPAVSSRRRAIFATPPPRK